MTGALHANAGWIELRIDGSWHGNAADACWVQVRQLQRSLEPAPFVLERYADAYRDVTDTIRSLEERVEEALMELIDWAVVAVTAAYQGPWPVVAKLLTYGFPPKPALIQAVTLVYRIMDLLELAVQAVWDFNARCELGMLTTDLSMPAVPSPASLYA